MVKNNKDLIRYISTHTLRKEGDCIDSLFLNCSNIISTHTLRKEGDGLGVCATQYTSISTHTLRKEGDLLI